MADCSLVSDGSSPDHLEILQSLRKHGLSPENYQDGKLRRLFDTLLSLFLQEISPKRELWPPPVSLGDGRAVDLFKLFWVVREMGGHDSVSKSDSWPLVSEASGLSPDVAASVRLIYGKYLEPLDRWLRWILDDKSPVTADSSDVHKKPQLGSSRVSQNGNGHGHFEESAASGSVDKASGSGDRDGVAGIEANGNGAASSSAGKRRREGESLGGMLRWVRKIAKAPGNQLFGRTFEGSKKNPTKMEYWKHALIIRKGLLLKRRSCSIYAMPLLQKRQRMHPSMYEDYSGYDNRSTENLRCSPRLRFLKSRSHSGSCSDTPTGTENGSDKSLSPSVICLENDSNGQVLRILSSLTAETVVNLFCKDQIQKRVPVGGQFQAEVPEWTGIACDSDDLKWLGTQFWPQDSKEDTSSVDNHSIGKGRLDSCSCKLPGSVECVRFHVAEKRFLLKLELGATFCKWRFDNMGEEVSLSWTSEEERRFKSIVYRNPLCFWDEIYKSFPSKSRQSLLSYYFNVFLLQRRSYQNRVTPNHIDSDDDDTEFAFVSSEFGSDAVNVSGFKTVLCAQNNQCMDLDENTYMD